MKKKLLCLGMTLCVLFGLFAGCAEPAKEEPSSDATPTQEVQTTSSPEQDKTNKAPGILAPDQIDESRYGGDLVVSNAMFASTCFPCETSDRKLWDMIAPAIEALGQLDEEGNMYPFLAESFEEDTENNTFTIKLREGIKFHDGSELNADVLMWNLEKYDENGISVNICYADSWEKVDEYTVKVYFEEYSNTWMETFCNLRIASQYAYDTYGEEYVQTTAVGTGPFIMEEYVQGHSIKYVRNENYWQTGLPYLDSVTIMLMSDLNTQLTAIMTGDIHVLTTSDGIASQQLQANSTVKCISDNSPLLGQLWLAFIDSYSEDKPTYDVNVRRAMMYAIDRDDMAVALSGGLGVGIDQYALEGSYAYLEPEELYSTYDYNPEKARELLAEAGYPNGFEMEILSRNFTDTLAVGIQSYLKAVGITATVNSVDSSKFTEYSANDPKGAVDFALAGASQNSFNNYNGWTQYISSSKSRYMGVLRDYDELDDLWQTAIGAKGIDNVKKGMQAINYFINENVHILPCYASYTQAWTVDNLYDSGICQADAFQRTYQLAYFAD